MKKIVVMHEVSIGDTLLATPVYRAIKEKYPEVKLVCVSSHAGRELLRGNPYIDELLAYQKGDPVLPVIKAIWRADAALILDVQYRNALYSFLAMIPRRIGRGKDFINVKVKDESQVEFEPLKYLRIAAQIGAGTDDLTLYHPQPSPEERSRVDAIVRDSLAGQRFVIIAPYSLAWQKDLQADKYREIIHRLQERGIAVVMIGGKNNRADIEREFPMAINMAGETNLRESAELISRAALQICGCTAMLHVCSSVGTPAVAVYGPTVPEEWAPRRNCTTITKRLPCSPCYHLPGPRCEDNKCIKDITVDEVWAEVARTLQLG